MGRSLLLLQSIGFHAPQSLSILEVPNIPNSITFSGCICSRIPLRTAPGGKSLRGCMRWCYHVSRWKLNPESLSSVKGVHNCQIPFTSSDQHFAVTWERGFLPVIDPSASDTLSLSSTSSNLSPFGAWEDVLNDLPKLLVVDDGNRLRSKVDQLPRFPHEELIINTNRCQVWRAMLVLSFIAHAYVWCGQHPAKMLPENMVRSWCAIAKHLDVPPVLSYATYNLLNWRRLDASRPIELGNIVCCYNFYGGVDEEWFRLIHVDIEAKAGPALHAIFKAQVAVSEKDLQKVRDNLICMTQTLRLMQKTLQKMGEKCDPYIYYHRIRRFMSGWRDNPDLPNGMLYGSIRKFFYGETGAQSAIIPVFDAALGVVHPSGPLSDYLQVMRLHMPSSHRDYLQHIETGPSIRDYVLENLPNLGQEYDECIQELFRFRSLHKNYAHAYIKKPAQDVNVKGTGGTDFMPYLLQNAVTTQDHRISS